MPVNARGFSLLEMLIAIAISSVLFLSAVRFLPALQRGVLQQSRMQMLEEDLWQRAFAISRHLQRAGYCASRRCAGEPLLIAPGCALIRWDSRRGATRGDKAADDDDVTGFRLRDGALETLRGAQRCTGKGWERMTDPGLMRVTAFEVTRRAAASGLPLLTVTLAARDPARGGEAVRASFSVTGYNL